MKKVVILAVVLIMLLLAGCEKAVNTSLPFEFDKDGNYTGFSDLPEDYTVEQAEKDGCYVYARLKAVGGEQLWKDFVQSASSGKDVSIRIVHIFDEEILFADLFYVDGYYRVFIPGSKNKKDRKFKYMLTLKGTLPNAAKSDKYTVLTDDRGLTYQDVTRIFLYSDRRQARKIPLFDFIMLEIDD